MGKSRIDMYLDIVRGTEDTEEQLTYLRLALYEAEKIEHRDYINLISKNIHSLEAEDLNLKPLFISILE